MRNSLWAAVSLTAALLLIGRPLRVIAQTSPSLPVRGWLVHSPERAYLDRVLEAAQSYRINHLELSHDVIMNADTIGEDDERATLIESVAKTATTRNIRTYIWAHELNTRDKNLDLDPSSDAGHAFWEQRRNAYRMALRRCPSLSGVVLMFGSSPTEVWEIPGRDAFWKSLSMPQRVRFVTELVRSVVVGEFGKELIVRDFNHSPAQLHWLVEGLRDMPQITVLSKSEPQDFEPFYPHSFSIGAYGTTPQILEIDLNGEYWGQSVIPVAQVGYLRYRMGYGAKKGVKGAVGRIDTYDNRALDTPAEVNIYAFGRLLDNAQTAESVLYTEWIKKRYGLAPGSSALQQMQTLLTRTFEIAKRQYFTLGFWTWKDLSTLPASMQQIERGIPGKSVALWDPKWKSREQKLMHPNTATVKAILREKAEAVTMTEQNLRMLEPLRAHLKSDDYTELERLLKRTIDLTRVYEAVAAAYWRTQLARNEPSASEGSVEKRRHAVAELERWADTLATRYADTLPVARQSERLRKFITDMNRLSSVNSAP